MASSTKQGFTSADLTQKMQQLQNANKLKANEMTTSVKSLLDDRLSSIDSALNDTANIVAPIMNEIENTLRMVHESLKKAADALAQEAVPYEKETGPAPGSKHPRQELHSTDHEGDTASPMQPESPAVAENFKVSKMNESKATAKHTPRRTPRLTTRRVRKSAPQPASEPEDDDEGNDKTYDGNTQ